MTRAIKILEILFEEIVELVRRKPYEMNFQEKFIWRLLFLEEYSAVVGYHKSEISKNHFSFLHVWNFHFKPCFMPEDFKKHIVDTPNLELLAGPIATNQWQIGQGRLLVEGLGLRYNYESVDLVSSEPFLGFTSYILNSTISLIQKKQVAKLSYWESFKNPDADYSKPS